MTPQKCKTKYEINSHPHYTPVTSTGCFFTCCSIKNEFVPLANCQFWRRAAAFFLLNVIFSPYYSSASFFLCSLHVKHAHYTHAEAIPDRRTQCTKGVIYYTELTIPRTITASLSNRLKMASMRVYAQTQKHTRCTPRVCIWLIQAQIQAVCKR